MFKLTRQEYNLKILKIIETTVKQYPNLRFYQVLLNLGLHKATGGYYEEPEETYKNLTKKHGD